MNKIVKYIVLSLAVVLVSSCGGKIKKNTSTNGLASLVCDESFEVVSVLVTSPHTVHSLCLEPLSPQVDSLSIIQSDEVCETTLIVVI